MIFYFTGTGNSSYVAKQVATKQNEALISVAECLKKKQLEFTLEVGEAVGFVFPTYFYGVPSIVIDFINKLKLNNYNDNYTFAILTCGGSIGNAIGMFKRILKRNDFILSSAFTVLMPDNYIIAFNLLPPVDKRARMFELAEVQIATINDCIAKRAKDIYILKRGKLPHLVTFLSYWYYKRGLNTKSFRADDNCVSCGLCEKMCPLDIIHLIDGRPIWKDVKCTQCLACIHRCPTHAIQYGKKTEKIERYIHPNL